MTDPIRVLHVEDEPDFADLTVAYLEQEDERFDIETVSTVSAGLDRIERGRIDCVVSDYEMHGKGGLELLRTVRHASPTLPFILFTGRGDEEVASAAIVEDVTDYVRKGGPEQFEELADRIFDAVSQSDTSTGRNEIECRYSAMFERSDVAIAWLDLESETPIVADANDRFAELVGTDSARVIDAPLSELISVDVDQPKTRRLAEGIRAGNAFPVETPTAIDAIRLQAIPIEDDESGEITNGLIVLTEAAEHEKHEARFRAFVERSSDVISVLAPDGTYLYQSPPVEHILGYDAKELLGENAFGYVHPADRPEIWEEFERAMRGEDARARVEYRFRHGDGSWRWMESRGNNQLDNPAIAGFVVNSHDITDRVSTRQQLQDQNERLERFASILSHELKDPLSVATGRLSLAGHAEEDEHLREVARAHDRMEVLIDDLLQFARAGRAAIDPENVHLPTMVTEARRDVGIRDASRVRTETDLTVRADPTRLRRLLANLLGNANEHGGEEVRVIVGELPDGFYVADDGPGIPEIARRKAFDPGYSTKTDGTGFGLSIVREIADAHDWDIAVRGSRHGGARFEVTGVERARSSSETADH